MILASVNLGFTLVYCYLALHDGYPRWFLTFCLIFWLAVTGVDFIASSGDAFIKISDLFQVGVMFYIWWKKRPPSKRRIRKLIGAKARQIRDKLVASMPKPKLLPNPSPA